MFFEGRLLSAMRGLDMYRASIVNGWISKHSPKNGVELGFSTGGIQHLRGKTAKLGTHLLLERV